MGKKYIVVEAFTLDELQEKVNYCIDHGYTPQGGMAVIPKIGAGYDVYMQAVFGAERRKKESANFTPPSIDEVRDYCRSRKNFVDAQAFFDFYTSKGWMVGKNKMKSWTAAVRTWEKTARPVGQANISDGAI